MLDLSRYVPALITHLSNKLSRGASALYRERFGIGIIEWRILAQLGSSPGSTARAICERTALDKAAVSRSFGVLLDLGLIALRKADGRRDQVAALTVRGKRLHAQMMKIALEREQRFLAPLSDGERRTLVALLNRLDQHVDSIDM